MSLCTAEQCAQDIGHPGSIREALTIAATNLAMATMTREQEQRFREVQFAGSIKTWLKTAAALKSLRGDIRRHAKKAIWWTLVAMVRIETRRALA